MLVLSFPRIYPRLLLSFLSKIRSCYLPYRVDPARNSLPTRVHVVSQVSGDRLYVSMINDHVSFYLIIEVIFI
jgi:hypothetical protein